MNTEFSMAFPPYGQSHFRSKTYSTLVRILSHLSPSTVPTQSSLPTIQEGEFEKEELYGHQVDEVAHSCLDNDKIIEALNVTEDGGLLDSTTMEDKYKTQNKEKSEKLICVTDATNSSNLLIEEGDLEEGEISGDFAMNGNTFDVSSVDATISEQMKVDEIQKPENSFGNKAPPFNMGNNGLVELWTINDIPTYLTPKQVLVQVWISSGYI